MTVTQQRVREIERLAEVRALAASGEARRIRLAAKLSQGDLGRACDVTESAVSRWENGERVPRGRAALVYGQVLAMLRDRVGAAA